MVALAIAAAAWSGSRYIFGAGVVVGLLWTSGLFLFLIKTGDLPAWQMALIDLIALAYFYRRWSAPRPQHRQFHFLLMCSYLTSTAFYAYQMALSKLAPKALLMSSWWFEFGSNRLFEFELIIIITYALLFRRAKADKRKWRADVNRWFDQAKSVKQAVSDVGKKPEPRADEP